MEDTRTNASMGKTVTELSLTPCGLVDHQSTDSSTELKDYVINYIDDPLVQSELNTMADFEAPSMLFVSEGDSCQLEVTQLPFEVSCFIGN
jgi:hypothetical protein